MGAGRPRGYPARFYEILGSPPCRERAVDLKAMEKGYFGKHVFLGLLGLLGVMVALLPCELWLRIYHPDQYQPYSYLQKHKRYLVNGQESIDNGMFTRSNYYAFESRHHLNAVITDRYFSFTQKVTTNGDGFRFFGNPNGQDKIMVLGDSVTFGVGVDDGESYPDQLQRLLGRDYQVLNYGVGCWGFAEYYLTYKRYTPQVCPGLIILGVFPSNDFDDLRAASWRGKAQGDLPRPPLVRRDVYLDREEQLCSTEWTYRVPGLRNLATFVLLNKVLVRRLTGRVERWADGRNPLATEALSLKIIADMAREHRVLVLLLPARYNYENRKFLQQMEHYGEKVQQIKGVHLIDFFPLVRARAQELYVDGSHFNQEGNRLVAQEIYGFLRKNHLLQGSKGSDSMARGALPRDRDPAAAARR